MQDILSGSEPFINTILVLVAFNEEEKTNTLIRQKVAWMINVFRDNIIDKIIGPDNVLYGKGLKGASLVSLEVSLTILKTDTQGQV